MPRRQYSSSDSGDEKKQKRRKQKRDYATRRRMKEKNMMQDLDSANKRLFKRSKRQKKQIDQLKTWAKYAKSYLSLCCQLLVFSPEVQADTTLSKPRPSEPVTSLHGMTLSTSLHRGSDTHTVEVFKDIGGDDKGDVCTTWTSLNPTTFEMTTTSNRFIPADSTTISLADTTSRTPDRFGTEDVTSCASGRFSTADIATTSFAGITSDTLDTFGTADVTSCTSDRFSTADAATRRALDTFTTADKTLHFQSKELGMSSARHFPVSDVLSAVVARVRPHVSFDKDVDIQCDHFRFSEGLAASGFQARLVHC